MMENVKIKEPEILKKVRLFLDFWENPDRVKEGESLSFKEFQFAVYDVSLDFTFKWYIKPEEIVEVAAYLNVELKTPWKLRINCGEYNFELDTHESL